MSSTNISLPPGPAGQVSQDSRCGREGEGRAGQVHGGEEQRDTALQQQTGQAADKAGQSTE